MSTYLILLGTVWPLISVGLTVILAVILEGWKRWTVLFLGPPVIMAPCIWFAEEIAYNGNMLFVAILGIMYLAAIIYYPLLLLTFIFLQYKNRKTTM